jgi:hypothetical protein
MVLALVAAFLVVGIAASGVLQPAAAFTLSLGDRDFDNDNSVECEGSFCFNQGSGDDEIEDFDFGDITFED